MQLDYYYEQPIKRIRYIERKITLESGNTLIYGPPRCGKSFMVWHYASLKDPKTTLFIDANDTRLDIVSLNDTLASFILTHSITTLIIDNYHSDILLPACSEIVLTAHQPIALHGFTTLSLSTLDFEEFLAFETKLETTTAALSRYLKLGSLPEMHHFEQNRDLYLQQILLHRLNEKEFQLFELLSTMSGHKMTIHQVYTRIKQKTKISKDTLYAMFESFEKHQLIYLIQKIGHSKAPKKLFLFDFTLKNAFTFQKDFNTLFSNLIFLELNRRYQDIFYEDGVDFYLPKENLIILSVPFATQGHLEHRLKKIGHFATEYSIKKILLITMNQELELLCNYAQARVLPFHLWAIEEIQ